MNETDYILDNPENTTNRIQCRLSQEQKFMLQRFMKNNPKLKIGKFTPDFTQQTAERLWSQIAKKLNKIPGARKTWQQWKRSWKDVHRNSKEAQYQSIFHYHEVVPEKIEDDDEDTCDSDSTSDNPAKEDDSNNADTIPRGPRMSPTQRRLLLQLVNANETLQQAKKKKCSVTTLQKRKEWMKIASKLNSVIGPQKSWAQWKICYLYIRKYYSPKDSTDTTLNSEADDISDDINTDNVKKEVWVSSAENAPSPAQINCMIRSIVEQQDIWKPLSETLNALGPCIKNPLQWENVWTEYKTKLQKFVDRNGTKKFNDFQRLAYDCIQREHSNDVCGSSVNTKLTESRIQHLQQSADQECHVIGNLVSVKLRSMQKEQKLVAEKLISEILFQGEMEMFQYSDKAVHIPGYM